MATLLAAMIVALVATLAACGEDPGAPAPKRTSVCAALREEPAGEVAVHGRGTHLRNTGFVLTRGRCSILVVADRKEALEVGDGDYVTVDGQVDALTQRDRRLLEFTLARGRRPALPVRGARPAPIGVGSAYLRSFGVTGEVPPK